VTPIKTKKNNAAISTDFRAVCSGTLILSYALFVEVVDRKREAN